MVCRSRETVPRLDKAQSIFWANLLTEIQSDGSEDIFYIAHVFFMALNHKVSYDSCLSVSLVFTMLLLPEWIYYITLSWVPLGWTWYSPGWIIKKQWAENNSSKWKLISAHRSGVVLSHDHSPLWKNSVGRHRVQDGQKNRNKETKTCTWLRACFTRCYESVYTNHLS